MENLFEKLRESLYSQIKLKENEKMDSIDPHLTIAFRDLSKEAFAQAWPELQQRDFEVSFIADKLFLLKHNGKVWEVMKVVDLTGF